MPWNGQSPWEYSRDKQAELKRYRDAQTKHANTIATVIKFASPVACIFVLYPLFMVITNYAALISMGLAIIAAYILVKTLTIVTALFTTCGILWLTIWRRVSISFV